MLECVTFCEARADAEIAQLLTARVLRDRLTWADGVLEHLIRWQGDPHLDGPRDWRFVKWTALKSKARRRGLRVHGRYGGNNKGEYAQARKALDYVALDYPHARAVILMRDDDGYARRPDFEAARQTADAALAVVLAIPQPEQEAWAIVAFQPRDDAEHARLAAARDRLDGEPRALAHTLSPKQSDHPRGTKTVLAQLCDDPTRALDALRDPPLDHLRTHGAAVGLTAFLDDIETRLTPLIGAPG